MCLFCDVMNVCSFVYVESERGWKGDKGERGGEERELLGREGKEREEGRKKERKRGRKKEKGREKRCVE